MIDVYVRCGWFEVVYGFFMELVEKGCDFSVVIISIFVNVLIN